MIVSYLEMQCFPQFVSLKISLRVLIRNKTWSYFHSNVYLCIDEILNSQFNVSQNFLYRWEQK